MTQPHYPDEHYIQEWLFAQQELHTVQYFDNNDNKWKYIYKPLMIAREKLTTVSYVPELSTREEAFNLFKKEVYSNETGRFRVVKICRTLANSNFVVFEVCLRS